MNIVIPYSIEKNYGKACNEAMRKFNSEDWVVIMDHDVLLLTPDTIRHIDFYTKAYQNAGMFTCYTNRISNRDQLLSGSISNNDSIRSHIALAKSQQQSLYRATSLTKPISGMLMVIKKSTWDQIKFSEDLLCLGVDNDYHKRLMYYDKLVLRMDGIYVFHTYRIDKSIKNKSHLYL